MGRKSIKSQLKQARIKQGKKQLAQSQAAVKAANSLADPLSDFPAFRRFDKNGLKLDLDCRRVTDLSEDVVDWLVDLMRRNVGDLYNACEWGWDEKRKRDELTESSAWYLIAYDSDKPVAFSHFRFDIDFGLEVLYVYELQLEPHVQRKGLGKHMSQLLELISFRNNMRKVVLTVLKHNKLALDFYQAMKYTLDETCPEDNFEEQFCYFILSKENKNFKPPAP